MPSPVTIKSVQSQNSIVFSEFDGDYYTVELGGAERSASRKVYVGYRNNLPSELFREITESWDGWGKDEKRWESLEGEFVLSARCDSLGHITVTAQLTNQNVSPEEPWTLEASLIVEAGQLEDIKIRVEQFFTPEGV